MRGINDTIAAVATGQGGAIAVIRVSGGDAVRVVDKIFVARNGKPLADAVGYTVHFGEICDNVNHPGTACHPSITTAEQCSALSVRPFASLGRATPTGGEPANAQSSAHNYRRREPSGFPSCGGGAVEDRRGGSAATEVVDEVLVTVFRAPHSYTGEDSVEISCHASPYIVHLVMRLLLDNGARAAGPGEFTTRAFLAGKLDLAQAEAVADLIASSDRAQHSLAMGQMRGGYSSALAGLRDELVTLASLLELELDFSEEDVQFADRDRLRSITVKIAGEIDRLSGSFSLGNVIKEGVPVAIVGRPNAGKSTLLNALVKEERAMVSEIAGTTRDRIEERVNINGVTFRFIDTAGIRATDDVLERMGIDRTLDAARKACLVLLVVDSETVSTETVAEQITELDLRKDQRLCVIINKIDKINNFQLSTLLPSQEASPACGYGQRSVSETQFNFQLIALAAKTGENLDTLAGWLRESVDTDGLYAGAAVVSNARHYEALMRSREALERVLSGFDTGSLSSDLLAEDISEVLHYLGTITGQITTDEILGTIFSRFCIGK